MKSGTRFAMRLLLLCVIVAAAIGGWFWFEKPVTQYETTRVKSGNVESVVAAIGTLSPRHSVEVGAQVSGQIITLSVEPGDTVEKGQLLVEIDASLQQATVDAGRAELASQRAQLASRQAQALLAKQQYQRQQKLMKRGVGRDEDLEKAAASLKTANAEVDQLNAMIEESQSRLKGDEARLGYTRIYSPMTGTVISVAAKVGQTLNATYSTPEVLSIADLGTMTVETEVAEADIRSLKPDMPAWFTVLGDNQRRWHGKVRQVLPSPVETEGNTVFYKVLFEVGNSDGELMSGMTAQVSFVTDSVENVLVVPLGAVKSNRQYPKPPTYSVQILDPLGSAQTTDVEIGLQDDEHAEVKSGLAAGEEVVLRVIRDTE